MELQRDEGARLLTAQLANEPVAANGKEALPAAIDSLSTLLLKYATGRRGRLFN